MDSRRVFLLALVLGVMLSGAYLNGQEASVEIVPGSGANPDFLPYEDVQLLEVDEDQLPLTAEGVVAPVADRGSSFWRLYRFCDDDAANDYCSPEWDPDCSGEFAAEQHLEGSGPQECVSQLVVNDFWTPDLFCGKDDDPHCP